MPPPPFDMCNNRCIFLEDLQIQKEADVQDALVCPISLPLQLQLLIYVLETAAEVGGEGEVREEGITGGKKICVSK